MVYRAALAIGRPVLCAALVVVFAATDRAVGQQAAATRIDVTLDPDVSQTPVEGRLYLFVSQRDGEPMRGPNWFSPEPFFRLDVTDFKPGQTLAFDDRAAAFPEVLSKLPAGKYRAQSILDHDFHEPRPADGVGNFYSEVVEITLGPNDGSPAVQPALLLNKAVSAPAFPESKWIKEVVLTSELLSTFHKREVIERAAVVLPASYYDDPDRRYPAVYIVPGFGGSHRDGLQYAKAPPKAGDGETEFIRVFLSGRCKWGHHVYADSATNGPRGGALVREMIPRIDRDFRTVAEPTARFVMGHSSGGWSSLWLQVAYPETFGGVWSSSPDPVDFRDFQQVDLYADPPQNMYRDPHGDRRPIARRGDMPVLWYDSFTRMDDTLGRGGQLRSFEAVFSQPDSARLPQRLWNRDTGEVDPVVSRTWEEYDIALVLKRDWQRLREPLAGKLNITMGTLDTFYLEGATELLARRLTELASDARVTMVEGANHGSLLTADYYARVRREMSEQYRKHHGRMKP